MKPQNLFFIMILLIVSVSTGIGCSSSNHKKSVSQLNSTPSANSAAATPSSSFTTPFPTSTPATSSLTSTPAPIPTEVPLDVDTGKPIIKGKSFDNLSGLKRIDEAFMNYKPKVSVHTNGDTDEVDDYQADASFDLNHDGKADTIQFVISSAFNNPVQAYIKVNNIKLNVNTDIYSYIDFRVGIHLIDLDKADRYIEIACYITGAKINAGYLIYRYDGKKLYLIGKISEDDYVDHHGKIVSSLHISAFHPWFCSAWYEIENNSMVLYENDTKMYLGKTYHFNGGHASFMYCDKMTSSKPDLDVADLYGFDACNIKLLDILYEPNSRRLSCYFVELSSGKKGMFYFY